MCGICGVVDLSGRPVEGAVVAAMAGTLHHRGPEATGVRLFPPPGAPPRRRPTAGLGHTRLKIIDLSDAANQPLGNEDGAVWAMLNGEIYNFPELRHELKAAGHQFRTEGDTEVIVHLYEELGEACVEQLDGMFALAVWDERAGRLLLARDRTGKKPLYYAHREPLLAFGSEIKALLAHPDIPTEVRVDALPLLFLHGYVPGPATLYRDVLQVPAGHALTVDATGGIRQRQYWDWRFPDTPGPRRAAVSPEEAAARVRDLLTEAVRKRLIADVPLGAFLSGGLDSSIVVALMSRLMREPVKTFSIGFASDARFDETRYARMVADRFGTAHTEFIVEPKAFQLLERLVHVYDGPFGDSSAIPTYILSELTRRHVTVALNGDGGDELFAGYERFAGGLIAGRVPPAVFRLGRAVTSAIPLPGHPRHPLRRIARFFGDAAVDADLPWLQRFSRWIAFFPEDLHRVVLESAAGDLRSFDRIAYFRRYRSRCERWSRLAQLLYLNAKTYLVDDLLVKMDRASMAHALETRSPFLDRVLMEYVATLPDRFKLRLGRTKWILRRAFRDVLPAPVLRRGKMGFGVPLATWFRGELREPLESLLLDPRARFGEYLNRPYVEWLVREHLAGRQNFEYKLWLLLTFEVWLRSMGRGPAPVC